MNIHPYWWAIFALQGRVGTVLPYWVMQHSTLVKSRDE